MGSRNGLGDADAKVRAATLSSRRRRHLMDISELSILCGGYRRQHPPMRWNG
jgi:hypothetical protein